MIHGANCNCKECESALSHKIESAFKDAELAKRFTELTGGKWHEWKGNNPLGNVCSCGSTCGNISEHIEASNPTYSNATDILNRMKEFCGEERYNLFMAQLEFGNSPEVEGIDWSGMIDVAYVENSTALLREAVEFLEGK